MSNSKNYKNTKPKSNELKILAIIIPALIVIIITAVLLTKQPSGKTSDQKINATLSENGDLLIPISDVSDKATFYPVTIDGTKMEVMAVKAPDGSIRTAFNTCQVCYASGKDYYVQEGDVLVCQNCGNRFSMSDVQVTKGGCNPVPITDDVKTVDSTNITIPKDYLTQAKVIFQNWKS